GGLEVDDQLKLRGLLDRQVSGLRALEDAGDITGGTPILCGAVRRVAHEAAFIRPGGGSVDRGQSRLCREIYDPRAVTVDEISSQDDDGLGPRLDCAVECTPQPIRSAPPEGLKLYAQCGGDGLSLTKMAARAPAGSRSVRPQNGHARCLLHDFLEELK